MKFWNGMRHVAFITILAIGGSGLAVGATVERLIDISSDRNVDPADREIIGRRTKVDPSIEWVVPVTFNVKALDSNRSEAFLNDVHILIIRDDAAKGWFRAKDVWHGYAMLPGDTPDARFGGMRDVRFFLRAGGRIYGSIRLDELEYTISTLPSGRHILTKQDVSKLPDGFDDTFPNPDLFEGRMPSGVGGQQMDTIRMVIGFTAAAEGGDQEEFLDDARDAVASANKSFADSGIMLQLEIAAWARPNYAETSLLQTWNDLSLGAAGPLWLVHLARNDEPVLADVVAMVVDVPGDECGRAPVGSTFATALMVVRRSCFGQFTLAHELGHLLSAHHNPENVGDTPALFPYGHGYRYRRGQGKGWSTVMAVGGSTYGRRNIWSTPLKQWLGQPVGTADTHDNARGLTQTKSTVASFHPDPSPIVPDGPDISVPLYLTNAVVEVGL